MSEQALTIPPLGAPTTARRPRVHRRTLANGLKIVVIRRPGVPLVEMRLRVPAPIADRQALAKTTVLAETMLKGTDAADAIELEQRIGLMGGQLNVGADHDKLMLGGSLLASNLREYLGLLAEVLTTASYPAVEVNDERERIAEKLLVAASGAGTAASKALGRRLFGDHPYAHVLAEPDEIDDVTPAAVRSLHRSRLRPEGAVLVLVGDLQPARAMDAVQAALGDWQGTPAAPRVRQVGFEPPGGILAVHRPGSVQSAIRVAMPVIGRDDDRYPALRVANTLFGGYFSSRLVANLREDKGYTYSPRSALDLSRLCTVLAISADVSSAVTAAALNEIGYELGRLATVPASAGEIEDARQYLIGSGSLSLSTQAGVAASAASLEYAGFGLEWVFEHQQRLAEVTAEQVRAVAAELVNPAQARTVVVGDLDVIDSQIRSIGSVDRA